MKTKKKKKYEVLFFCVVCGKSKQTKEWDGDMWKSYFVCKRYVARTKQGKAIQVSDKHAKFLRSIKFPCVLRKTVKKR